MKIFAYTCNSYDIEQALEFIDDDELLGNTKVIRIKHLTELNVSAHHAAK